MSWSLEVEYGAGDLIKDDLTTDHAITPQRSAGA